jgi:CubicO group peptidase (beta-lactamase class C family)
MELPMKALMAAAITLAVLVGAMSSAASTPGARVGNYLDHHWPHGASGTVLVARGGHPITCRGLGWADRGRRVRATCDTAYDIMSMTKQFTAAGIVKLRQQGRLHLTDRIGRYLPRVPKAKRAITIDQLLTHTSGLVDSLGGDYQPLTRKRLIARAMRSQLISRPGAAYHYSNVGYSLLAVIIAKASGISYERFLHRRLFRPAGMTHTGYLIPRWRPHQIAVEYDRRGRSHGRPTDHPWGRHGPYWNLRGNGGMLSTARDLLRWHRALLHHTVLDKRSTHALFAPRVRVAKGDWAAYGWDFFSSPLGKVAAHNGGNGWSFGVIARVRRSRTLVFWVSNHAYQANRWNLERRQTTLTLGLAKAASRR